VLSEGRRTLGIATAITLAILVSRLAAPTAALEHEPRDVGAYRLTVGFLIEPVYEGLLNGVDFRVQTLASPPTPVTGLEKTVQVEITYVPTGKAKTMPITAVFNQPGYYTAPILPTSPGRYQFRFFGTINGTQINETFVSGPNTFDDVTPASDIQFPDAEPQVREITGAVQGAQQDAASATDAAAAARRLAVIGIAVGALGLVSGLGSAAWAWRRTSSGPREGDA
jgi:hypothetical protein